jgi:hypothetical protein
VCRPLSLYLEWVDECTEGEGHDREDGQVTAVQDDAPFTQQRGHQGEHVAGGEGVEEGGEGVGEGGQGAGARVAQGQLAAQHVLELHTQGTYRQKEGKSRRVSGEKGG